MQKVALVTGVTGMVGSHMADYLLENTNWNIAGMCRWRSPLDNIAHHVPLINEGKRFQLHYADLRDANSINELVRKVRPDFVFHLAAQSFPKTSFSSAEDTLDTNIQGTVRVLESLRNYAPKAVIHVCASSEVFGRVSKKDLPINEECNFHPASPYAISKVGTDLIGRFYAEAYGMMIMTTRMFTHTGPRRGDVFAESSFAKQIALIEAGFQEPVVNVGNLDSLRTFSDVRDAVRAYHLLVTKNPVRGAYYNIGGDYTASVREMLASLLALSQCRDRIQIQIDRERMRAIDADLQVPDTTKFRQHTGWRPEISFETTMIDLLNYWRKRIAASGNVFLSR